MKRIIVLAGIFILFGLTFFFLQSSKVEKTPYKSGKVAATIFPLYDIVRNIAGDDIETILILQPGTSPHSFDPSPNDIKQMQGSDTVFMIGHGIDNWSLSLAESAGVQHHTIVDKNVMLNEFSVEDHSHEGEESVESDENSENKGIDPHYWLSIQNAKGIAKQVKDELITRYPLLESSINENYNSYILELDELQVFTKDRINQLENKNMATFHNAWSYFAEESGLTIVTTFEEFPGEEPTPEYLSEFIEHIQEDDISVIYAEPQFSTTTLEPIASDLNVTLSQLDPLGGTEGRESYLLLMRYNVNQITSIQK